MDNDFGPGFVFGAVAMIVFIVIMALVMHISGVNDRWKLYVECVESEKVSFDFCAKSYQAPEVN